MYRITSCTCKLSGLLQLIVCLSLVLSCQNSKAQVIQWNGTWVGSWSGSGTSGCGDYIDGGLMVLTISDVSNIVAGAGAMAGIYCCQDLGYQNSAGPLIGTISNKTIRILAENWPVDGPCGPLSFSITATNSGTLIVDSIFQSGSGSDFSGHVFLETAPAGTTTNNVSHPTLLPNGGLSVVVNGIVGSNYTFQVSTNLVNWSSISNLIFTNPPMIVSDNAASSRSQSFYRVVPIPFGTNCTTPLASLVAWWPANGNAVDIVGGNNGILTNGVTYVPGEVGQAFNFNSNRAMVWIGNSASLQLQNFTIEAWCQRRSTSVATSDPSASGGDAILFGYGQDGYALGMAPNGTLFLTKVGVSSVSASTAVRDTNWHHVAVTTSSGTVVFYLDGVAYPAGSYHPTYQFTTPAAIGGRGDNVNTGNNDSFLGSLDAVSIYSGALSSDEIAAIYLAGSNGKCPPRP